MMFKGSAIFWLLKCYEDGEQSALCNTDRNKCRVDMHRDPLHNSRYFPELTNWFQYRNDWNAMAARNDRDRGVEKKPKMAICMQASSRNDNNVITFAPPDHICCSFRLSTAHYSSASVTVALSLDRYSCLFDVMRLYLNGSLYSGWSTALQRWYSGQVLLRHPRRKFMHNGLIVAHIHM